jgi:hypothetical protein
MEVFNWKEEIIGFWREKESRIKMTGINKLNKTVTGNSNYSAVKLECSSEIL